MQPLFVRQCKHGQRLELKPRVVLEAIKDGFHAPGDRLLTVSNVTGFTLHGPGATLRMHRSDYHDPAKYSKSEDRVSWMMLLFLPLRPRPCDSTVP